MELNLSNLGRITGNLNNNFNNEPLISNSKVTQKQVEDIFKKIGTVKSQFLQSVIP